MKINEAQLKCFNPYGSVLTEQLWHKQPHNFSGKLVPHRTYKEFFAKITCGENQFDWWCFFVLLRETNVSCYKWDTRRQEKCREREKHWKGGSWEIRRVYEKINGPIGGNKIKRQPILAFMQIPRQIKCTAENNYSSK